MKTSFIRVPAFIALVLLMVQGCTPARQISNYKPIRWDGQGRQREKVNIYKKDEIIVIFKNQPSDQQKNTIKQALLAQGITVTDTRKCGSCDLNIELWKGDSIHTTIHTDGVVGGSGGAGSRGVGEDSLAHYSLNYINQLPVDMTPGLRDSISARYRPQGKDPISGIGKDTITIAVLDTGIDTVNFVSKNYCWTNSQEKNNGTDADHNCYVNDVNGWNFVGNSPDIRDDHGSLHGTLVSSFIIDEFKAAGTRNFVQIMNLKTHDQNGFGDLFSSICAMHYAANKGANIINASWGFYYYQDAPHPYLDSLITRILRAKGILFVAAAGNKIPAEDALAKQIYLDSFGITLPDSALRNLEVHNFYPACYSDAVNNVLTVTTTDSNIPSPTQNYSDKFVDLGVKADLVTPDFMKFRETFTAFPVYISGSSFAAAIASGKIGTWLPRGMYTPGIKKEDIFTRLQSLITAGTISPILVISTPLEAGKKVRKGRYSMRR